MRRAFHPREVVERYHASFLESWEQMGISFDLFTTTMTDNHREVTHDLWRALQTKGYIYEASMKVAYSPDFDRFLPDRYVRGVCPKCGFEDARGDQCDNCGAILDPVDLGNPAYIVDGKRYPVEIRDTEHQFLRLSAFRDQLGRMGGGAAALASRTCGTSHSGFLREGLKDRAITRNLDWGLPVPAEGYEDRRIYVWFEAVIGYLSASVEWAARKGEPDAWRPFWEDPSTRAYYFVGKDNIPFHTIIWPAMLLGQAAYILPYDVPANEFLNLEGQATLDEPQLGGVGAGLLGPVPARSPALPPCSQSARDRRRRLHVERIRPPQQRRARRDVREPRASCADAGLSQFRQVQVPDPSALGRSGPGAHRQGGSRNEMQLQSHSRLCAFGRR